MLSLAAYGQTTKAFEDQIMAFLREYYQAVNSRDAEKTISYYLNSPDFFVFSNGVATPYDQFVSNVRAFLSTAKEVQFSYKSPVIRKLGNDVALVTGVFEEKVVDAAGKISNFDITTSITLLKQDKRWKIACATSVYQEKKME